MRHLLDLLPQLLLLLWLRLLLDLLPQLLLLLWLRLLLRRQALHQIEM